jgi:carbon storage regulator
MLILARRPGERVVIGDEILVTVMEVSGSTVRLGIEAPRGVSIFREEIWLAVKEENRAAAEAQADALPSGPIGEIGQADAPPPVDETGSTDSLPSRPVGEVEPADSLSSGPVEEAGGS